MQMTSHMKSWGDVLPYYDAAQDSVVVGANANIATTVLFRRNLIVGEGSLIDDHCYFTCNMTIGKHVHIAPYVYACGGDGSIRIGDYAGVSTGCKLLCCTDNYITGGLQHPAIPEDMRDAKSPIKEDVVLGKAVLLGMGTIVLPGCLIPNGVSTGVNVVVTKAFAKIMKPWTYYDASGRSVPRRVSPAIKESINNS